MKIYLDSSVIITSIINPKFGKVVSGGMGQLYTSRLSQVEVFRNVMKKNPELLPIATKALFQIEFVELTDAIIDTASAYPQEITLKSSDAIHVATAEYLLDSDDVLVTYDKQMALNAEKLGLKVLTSF